MNSINYSLLTVTLSLSLLFIGIGCQQTKSLDDGRKGQATSAAVSQDNSLEKLKGEVAAYSSFSADDAWKNLQTQVNMGPRYVGSLGHEAMEKWLKDELAKLNYKVVEQKFTATTPQGAKGMNNILACFNFSPEKNSIIVGAHYDTKVFEEFSFVGANDGASGVAVLLELAKVYAKDDLKHNIVFCFFDGEEAFEQWQEGDSLYGSSYFVKSLGQKEAPFNLNKDKIVSAVILDMVGDKDLKITYDTISHPELMAMYFDKARSLGFTKQFKRENSGSVSDDHLPFLTVGIPALDIIGFRQTEQGIYPQYWHTQYDRIDKVSEESLLIIGASSDAFIKELDETLE